VSQFGEYLHVEVSLSKGILIVKGYLGAILKVTLFIAFLDRSYHSDTFLSLKYSSTPDIY